MAEPLLSVQDIPANGTQTVFEFNFAGGYISREHVSVLTYTSRSADGQLVGVAEPAFTFINDYTLSIPGVPAGRIVRIYRNTPFDKPLVDFSDGSVVNEKTLDLNADQAVFLAAELRDRFASVVDVETVGYLVDQAQAALASVNTAAAAAITNILNLSTSGYSTRAEMAAVTGLTVGRTGWLREADGVSQWDYYTGAAPSDPMQGLYVAVTAGGYWARRWDGMSAKPEWFGAKPNDNTTASAITNRLAIQECFTKCQVTELQAKDYYINDVLQLNTNYHVLQGRGPAWDALGKGARIIQKTLTKDVILVGNTTSGASGMYITDITACWDGLPLLAATAQLCPRGFNFQKITGGKFRGLSVINGIISFFAYGTVYCKWFDTNVSRNANLPGPNADRSIGFWVSGVAPAGQSNAYAGGNASVYLYRTNITYGDNLTNKANMVGIVCDGDFADTYIDDYETVFVPFPLIFDGAAGVFSGGHGDVHVKGIVFDQCSGDGVTVRNTNQLAKLQFNGGYVQIRDVSGNAGFRISTGAGFVTMENIQILSGANLTSYGVRIIDHGNVSIGESVIIESIAYPVRIEGASPRCSVTCHIGDGASNSAGTRAAVTISNTGQAHIAPDISGAAGSWAAGVDCVSAARVSIDVTRIDATACAGGRQVRAAGNKVNEPGYHNLDGSLTTTVFTGIHVTGTYG